MAKEPMELAKNWDESKAQKVLPAYAQIKYDGVPLTFTRLINDTFYQIVGDKPDKPETLFAGGSVIALTRQNEVAVSVSHLIDLAALILNTPGASFTAECFVPGLPFKNSSGIIRRTTPDADTTKIRGVIFDANCMNRPKDAYMTRFKQAEVLFEPLKGMGFHIAPYKLVNTVEEVNLMWETLQQLHKVTGAKDKLEGMMLHSLTKPFMPGKRCWGMSRFKPQPTIDLEVASFEEALASKDAEANGGPPAGTPLGMVGRVNVRLRRRQADGSVVESVVGVGPGKLTHEERIYWWQWYNAVRPTAESIKFPFAEIKYMPDESYDALRQPTVQYLRTDKTEGDILEYV